MKLKYIDGFDEIKHLPFEQKVIEVLGPNHTDTISFKDAKTYDDPYGLYTYKGEVCVLKHGSDYDYADLTDQDKEKLTKWFDSRNWEIDNALQ